MLKRGQTTRLRPLDQRNENTSPRGRGAYGGGVVAIVVGLGFLHESQLMQEGCVDRERVE